MASHCEKKETGRQKDDRKKAKFTENGGTFGPFRLRKSSWRSVWSDLAYEPLRARGKRNKEKGEGGYLGFRSPVRGGGRGLILQGKQKNKSGALWQVRARIV